MNFLYKSATLILMSTKTCPRPDGPPTLVPRRLMKKENPDSIFIVRCEIFDFSVISIVCILSIKWQPNYKVRGPVPKDCPLHPASNGVLGASRDRGDGGVHQHALPEEEEEQVQKDRDDVSWKWKVILLMLGNQILVLPRGVMILALDPESDFQLFWQYQIRSQI